ncbi:flagellar hook-length control protein FliK [Lysinibacillus fusiformis]|uniref:flagellar hook-length control protein FliK n=1 Tax=Lysinibacillus fusiformis TaxID=28031 RepID=UPI00215B5262|nr:flagellar hook-length control protein FliK [Lysinibacillus fusiformis]MCR8851579.1 flagellar hook-length control protein FliK [Lysinibacillus fusiformis]
MDIAMMKMITQSVPTKTAATKATTSNSTDGKIEGTSKQETLSKFGSVFGQVLSSSTQSNQSSQATPNNELADLQQVLNADSLEEVLDLLGIPHDNGLLILQLGEDGKAVSMDEMLDLDNILNVLGIEDEQLQKIVQQLLGEEKEASDVWELLSLVDAQAPILQAQIGAALQGEGQVTPKEATQLLQVLKLAQLVGQKSDLIAPQENLLTTVKSLLTTLQTQVETIQVTTTKSTGTFSLQGFQQVQMTKQSETSSNEMVTPQTVQTKPDTFQITLPTAKPAQSEALLKEMQAIINRAQISNAQGITRLTIKLYPENLGTIRIELVQNDGVLTARLLASTAHGREMLDSQAHQLKQAFVQQNIQVDRLDIAQSLQDADRQQRDQNFFNNFFRQQQDEEQQQKTEDDDEEMSFSDYLLSEEV